MSTLIRRGISGGIGSSSDFFAGRSSTTDFFDGRSFTSGLGDGLRVFSVHRQTVIDAVRDETSRDRVAVAALKASRNR